MKSASARAEDRIRQEFTSIQALGLGPDRDDAGLVVRCSAHPHYAGVRAPYVNRYQDTNGAGNTVACLTCALVRDLYREQHPDEGPDAASLADSDTKRKDEELVTCGDRKCRAVFERKGRCAVCPECGWEACGLD